MADAAHNQKSGRSVKLRKAWTAPRVIEAGLSVARHTQKTNSFPTAEYHLPDTTQIS
jgi:hypothetical protein